MELAVSRKLKRGEALALQGDVWPYLFLVVEGELEAVKCSFEGRNLLVTTFKQGDLFWGTALFQDGMAQLATLEANCQTLVFLWTKQLIEPIFFSHGHMSWELCSLMVQRMQRASAIVEDLAFQSVSGRLASLLLDNFDTTGEKVLERSLTLDEIAARIGTTREMVCRALYRFADRKLINVTRTEFILTDRDGLTLLRDSCK